MKLLLVHGLWNSRHWLAPLAWRLHREGFEVELFGYASLFGGAEAAMPRLAERIAASGARGLVGHSLGGLLALETLRRRPGTGRRQQGKASNRPTLAQRRSGPRSRRP